jgi:hypothetical protein
MKTVALGALPEARLEAAHAGADGFVIKGESSGMIQAAQRLNSGHQCNRRVIGGNCATGGQQSFD